MTFAVEHGKSAATAEVHRTTVVYFLDSSHREQYTSGDGHDLQTEVVITRNTVALSSALVVFSRGRHCSNDSPRGRE